MPVFAHPWCQYTKIFLGNYFRCKYMRHMYSHPGEYRKIFLANYLCIGFVPGGITKKNSLQRKCFGAINFVKITKEALYKANSLACFPAKRGHASGSNITKKIFWWTSSFIIITKENYYKRKCPPEEFFCNNSFGQDGKSEELKKAVAVSEEKFQQRSRRRGQFPSSRFPCRKVPKPWQG